MGGLGRLRRSAAKAKRRGASTPADRTGPRGPSAVRAPAAASTCPPAVRDRAQGLPEDRRWRRARSPGLSRWLPPPRSLFAAVQAKHARFLGPRAAHLVLKSAWCRAKRDFWQASRPFCKANFQLVARYLSTLAWARSQRLRACTCRRCCLDLSPPRLSHNFVGSDPLARGCAWWPAAVGSSTTIHLHVRLSDAYSRQGWSARPLGPRPEEMASRGCPKILRALPRCGATEA